MSDAATIDVKRVVLQSDKLKARGKDLFILARSMLGLAGSAPSFFLVGVQKGGTTYLDSLLRSHPGLAFPMKKEPHYFDRAYQRGDRWYRSHFPLQGATAGRLVGESTPTYMSHPQAMERLRKFSPGARIVMLLRDPVKRAISHYRHNVSWKVEYLSFRDAIEREAERLDGEVRRMQEGGPNSDLYQYYSYFERGLYARQIREIYRHFDRSQVLVLKSEQLFRQPSTVVDAVCAFLGVPTMQQLPIDSANRNRGEAEVEIDEAIVQKLKERYEAPNRELFDLLGWSSYAYDPSGAG